MAPMGPPMGPATRNVSRWHSTRHENEWNTNAFDDPNKLNPWETNVANATIPSSSVSHLTELAEAAAEQSIFSDEAGGGGGGGGGGGYHFSADVVFRSGACCRIHS